MKGGGGLIVYARSSIRSEQITLASSNYEHVHLNLTVGESHYRLLALYRAPDPANFGEFMSNLEEFMSCGHIKTIIVGDLNISIPNLSVRPYLLDSNGKKYIDLLTGYGYKVTNNLPTRPISGKTIDHVVTNVNQSTQIYNHTIEIDSLLSDHNAIITCLRIDSNRPRQIRAITKPKLNLDKLAGNLPDAPEDWFKSSDANFIANSLTHALQTAISSSTTFKNFSVKHEERICEWSSVETLSLISEKDKLLRKRRKKPRSQKIRNELETVSFKLAASIQKDFRLHVDNKVSTNDPKKMWRGLNEILGRDKSAEVAALINPRTLDVTTDPIDVAEIFNETFASCAAEKNSLTSDALRKIYVENFFPDSFFLKTPDEDEILRQIFNLKANSADGHDQIGSKVIKALASVIAPILTHLITVIFDTGVYPETFKLALITPIFKNGCKTEPDNYRPISVLPAVDKIIERVLRDRLTSFFDKKLKATYSHQFGFRDKCNTENAALELVAEISQARDMKKCATGLFMDLKKAFDIVNHEILLEILYRYGVRGKTNELFRSFLTNRRQIVKVGTAISQEKHISSGVVQGSCLGPLLFIIFINAVGFIPIQGRLFLFADDAVLINIHEKQNPEEIIRAISKDLEPILRFFSQRKMELNCAKTKLVSFTTPATLVNLPSSVMLAPELKVERVKSIKYLGLVMNENLSWATHIENVEKKLAPASGILWKLRHSLPQQTRRLIYDTLFQTHLNYMTPVWGFSPWTALTNAQVIQNRALRNVYDLPWRTPRNDMYQHHVENHLPIRGICILNTAVFMYKTLHYQTHTNICFSTSGSLHNRNLRNSEYLRPHPARSKAALQAINTAGPQVFNKVPKTIKDLRTPFAFRWALRCHLRRNEFISTCFASRFYEFKF